MEKLFECNQEIFDKIFSKFFLKECKIAVSDTYVFEKDDNSIYLNGKQFVTKNEYFDLMVSDLIRFNNHFKEGK